MNMSSRSREVLTLEQRAHVVQRSEKGESARAIALSLCVGKTQIQSIVAKNDEVMAAWKSGTSGRCQYRLKASKYDALNDYVWEWFSKASSRDMVVTGP